MIHTALAMYWLGITTAKHLTRINETGVAIQVSIFRYLTMICQKLNQAI